MAKSRRLLQEQLRAVDAVIELCDARAPQATRNPDLGKLTTKLLSDKRRTRQLSDLPACLQERAGQTAAM